MSLCRDDLSETLIELAEIPGGRGEYAFTYSEDSQESGAPKRIAVLAPNGAGEWQAEPVAYLTVVDVHGTPYWQRSPRRKTLTRVVDEFLDVPYRLVTS